MAARVVLVTGAAGGIGLECARLLAADGDRVLLSARDARRAATAAGSITNGSAEALALDLDVTSPAAVGRAAEMIGADPGRIDVLINNAAAFVDWTEMGSTADLVVAREVMETNLFGAWRMTMAMLPLLRRSPHPRVVNVSSGAGSHGDEQFGLGVRGGAAASYGVSKAALNALTSTLAAELAGTGVLVNAVCPGLTATFPGAERMGARPVTDGAASILFAAGLPDDGPSGGFFRDGRPLAW